MTLYTPIRLSATTANTQVKEEKKMKYEAPQMEVVSISADSAVANEVELDFGAMISKEITP